MLWRHLAPKNSEYIIQLLHLFHQNNVPWGNDPNTEQFSMAQAFKRTLLSEFFDILETMIQCGGYVNYKVTPEDISLFHVTTTQGNLKTSRWLVEHGVDVHAIEHGHNAAVPLILSHSNPREEETMDQFFELFKKVDLNIEQALKDLDQKQHPQMVYIQNTMFRWKSKLEKEKLEKEIPAADMTFNTKTRI